MNVASLAVRNVLRNKFRTALTVMGVAVAALTFLILRTVLAAWTVASEYAAKDRIATRNKITFVSPLPLRYYDRITRMPGIKQATYMNWFGGKNPRNEKEFFATLAVEPDNFFSVYDDMYVEPDVIEAWRQNRQGAIVGEVIAKKFHWNVGDKVILNGTIFPGNWTFTIVGIYHAKSKAIDNSSFLFHWKYLNESQPERFKDQVGWIVARVNDPKKAADISKKVDLAFAEEEIATLSMSERAMNNSFMAMFSAVLKAMDIVSVVILMIMALILGNTIAMGVRERTAEFGAMRAMGFLPKHLGTFVITEGVVIGTAGGVLGLLIGYPLINQGLGRFIEENLGSLFPYFRVPLSTAWVTVALSITVAVLAALVPAVQAYRLNVINAIRRVA